MKKKEDRHQEVSSLEMSKKLPKSMVHLQFLGAVVTIVLGVGSAYAFSFPVFPSKSSGDWANFGTYFSGLLTPLASIAGAWILLSDYLKRRNQSIEEQTRQIEEKNGIEREKNENSAFGVVAAVLTEIRNRLDIRIVVNTEEHMELSWRLEELLKKGKEYKILKTSYVDDSSRLGTKLESDLYFILSMIEIAIDKFSKVSEVVRVYVREKVILNANYLYSNQLHFRSSYRTIDYSSAFNQKYDSVLNKIRSVIDPVYGTDCE